MNCLSDGSRIACEAPAPIVMADYANGRLAGRAVIVWGDRPSQRRVYAQHRVIIPAHELSRHRRLRLSIHTHAQAQRVIGKQAREDFVLIADLPVSAIRECGNSLAAEGARE